MLADNNTQVPQKSPRQAADLSAQITIPATKANQYSLAECYHEISAREGFAGTPKVIVSTQGHWFEVDISRHGDQFRVEVTINHKRSAKAEEWDYNGESTIQEFCERAGEIKDWIKYLR